MIFNSAEGLHRIQNGIVTKLEPNKFYPRYGKPFDVVGNQINSKYTKSDRVI